MILFRALVCVCVCVCEPGMQACAAHMVVHELVCVYIVCACTCVYKCMCVCCVSRFSAGSSYSLAHPGLRSWAATCIWICY